MAVFDILISGAGIAGPALALVLSHSNIKHNITVVERSPVVRTTGQQIDLRLAGISIFKRLGLIDALDDITVKETGIAFVDTNNKVKAAFPTQTGDENQSLSSEYEILRGSLAELLYNKTKNLPNVQYIFGDRVSDIEQKEGKVHVNFEHGTPNATYDILVAADGMHSRTRDIAWRKTESDVDFEAQLHSLDSFVAFFTASISDEDLNTTENSMARWYSATHRRGLLVRPDLRNKKTSSAMMSVCFPPSSPGDSTSNSDFAGIRKRLEAAAKSHDENVQKTLFEELFKDVGWEAHRLIEAMYSCDDFYMQEIAQVKLSPGPDPPHLAWSRGQVVCLGDTAYCPSPMTGMGTTLAILGAYTLGGEIARVAAASSDSGQEGKVIKDAVASYEHSISKYVQQSQKLAPGAPHIINPETQWGIWIMYNILSFVSKTGLSGIFGKFAASYSRDTFKLQEYEELNLPAPKT